jgi:polyisoprenoid-binding protein YceI
MHAKDFWTIVSAFVVATFALGQIVAGAQPDVQSPRSASPDAQKASLGPGDINVGASRVYIFVDKTGFGHQHAVAGRIREGNLRIAGRSAGRIVFDLRSFIADTPEARRYIGLKGEMDGKTQQDVTANMLAADVLDVSRFPTATFDVDSLQPIEARGGSGKVQYRVDGEFKLHGAKRPLRFVADGIQERGYLHLKGSFRLRQTEYRIRPFQKALGAVGVADVLTVYGDIWIKQ